MRKSVWKILMHFTALSITITGMSISGRAAFEFQPCGTRALAMGSTSLSTSGYAVFYQPALLAFEKQRAFQFDYARLYGIQELGLAGVASSFPVGQGTFGIAVSSLGKSEYYRENVVAIGYARRFANQLFFGLASKIWQVALPEPYSAPKGLALDLGGLIQANGIYHFGVAISNLLIVEDRGQDIFAPVELSWAGRARIGERLSVTSDLAWDKISQMHLRFGQEYQVSSNLFFQFGLLTDPARFSLGAGVKSKVPVLSGASWLLISYAYLSHPILGGTQSVGIVWSW